MSDINNVACQHSIAPASMCCVQSVAHWYILECLTICLNLHREAPNDVVELVQGIFECCKFEHEWFVSHFGCGGLFGGKRNRMGFLDRFTAWSSFCVVLH